MDHKLGVCTEIQCVRCYGVSIALREAIVKIATHVETLALDHKVVYEALLDEQKKTEKLEAQLDEAVGALEKTLQYCPKKTCAGDEVVACRVYEHKIAREFLEKWRKD